MEIKPKYKTYYSQVWNKAKSDAHKFLLGDWRGIVGGIVIAIASAITAILLGTGGNMPGILVVVLSSIGGGFAWIIIVLVSMWVTAPAKIFREKEVLADIYTWNDVDIVFYEHDELSLFGDGIELKNNKPKPHDIINASIYLTGGERDRTALKFSGERRFDWINEKANELQKGGTVLEAGGGKKRFPIIDYKDGDQCASISCEDLGIAIYPNSTYILRTEIRGRVLFTEIPPLKIVLRVNFDGESKKIRMVRYEGKNRINKK